MQCLDCRRLIDPLFAQAVDQKLPSIMASHRYAAPVLCPYTTPRHFIFRLHTVIVFWTLLPSSQQIKPPNQPLGAPSCRKSSECTKEGVILCPLFHFIPRLSSYWCSPLRCFYPCLVFYLLPLSLSPLSSVSVPSSQLHQRNFMGPPHRTPRMSCTITRIHADESRPVTSSFANYFYSNVMGSPLVITNYMSNIKAPKTEQCELYTGH